MNDTKKQKIAEVVIEVLIKRFEKFPEDATNNRNAPFHAAFLNAFRDKLENQDFDVPFFVSLSSWLHGLSTTLGQTFFERTAHILSDGEKREYTSKKLGNLQMHQTQKNKINEIMTALSNSERVPNFMQEQQEINSCSLNEMINSVDFAADVWYEDSDNIVAIEMKSVKPNSGEMKNEKNRILEGRASLKNSNPNKNISFYIGFPFDPTSDSDVNYDKNRFMASVINMNKFFDPDEVLLASELWDKLSGETGTMESILMIINSISQTNFMENYQYLQDGSNRNNPRYAQILNDWYLFSESRILENEAKIITTIQDDMALQRFFNQKIFKKEKYNWDRASKILEII